MGKQQDHAEVLRRKFEGAFATGDHSTDATNFHRGGLREFPEAYTHARIQALWEGWQKHAAISALSVDDALVERFCVAFLAGHFPTKAVHNDNVIRHHVRAALQAAIHGESHE